MQNFKFIVLSLITIMVLGLLGVWAVSSLQSGTEYRVDEIISNLKDENDELKKEVATLTKELDKLRPEEEEIVDKEEDTKTVVTTPSVYKHQTLINELEKLITDNISMKLKSRGSRVGTVQNFLNIYNKTSKKVDNDYGNGTKADVTAFQRAEGLTADGEAGESTFRKMIDWLKKQG